MRRTPPKRPQRAYQKESNYSLTTWRAQEEADVFPDEIVTSELLQHKSTKPDDMLSEQAHAAEATATIEDAAAAPAMNNNALVES